MYIISNVWFWSDKFQLLFLKHIGRKRNFGYSYQDYSILLILQEKMSYLKTRDFVALRTSFSIDFFVWWN